MDYLVYNLAELSAETADFSILLPDEQKEAERRGPRYALIRTLLRKELARRTSVAAQDIRFEYGPHGKPECLLQHFNISHSGDCLCLAFHHLPIGVDVERIRERNFKALAARFMAPEQFEQFCARGCTQEDFFPCWCAAEALVKHAGDTMWNARHYPFLYRHGRIQCVFDSAPQVCLFTPMPGYCGAVACSLP